jgi:hypothetical protein
MAGAVQPPAAHPLGDLGALVLGDHPLELAQKLVLGRAGALGLAGEDDLHPHTLKLLEQQHLIGIAAGEPVGRVAQQYLEGALRRAVAQPLERRAGEHGAREALVAEHELLGDEQAATRRQLTQPADLALDGPLVPLAIRRDAGVDRRQPRRCRPASDIAILPRSLVARPQATALRRQDRIRLGQTSPSKPIEDQLHLDPRRHLSIPPVSRSRPARSPRAERRRPSRPGCARSPPPPGAPRRSPTAAA